MQSAKVQVGVTQKELESVEGKISLIPTILTDFEFILYNLDRDTYINQLNEFLNEYAIKEGFDIALLPYQTEDEQVKVLNNLNGADKKKAKRFLLQNRSINLEKETLALYPFIIYDYIYIVQVQALDTDTKITEVDGSIITSLIMTYDLAVLKIKGESGEE